MDRKFYIADTHFSHENVIQFDNRPFATIEEHDRVLIERWNSVIKNKNDHVYVLGDFIWKAKGASDILKKLNGSIHLIIGNHDKHYTSFKNYRQYLVEATHMKEVKDNKIRIVLSHYPNLWHRIHRNDNHAHFYGHVHMTDEFTSVLNAQQELMNNPMIKSAGRSYNVGANLPYMDYTPRSAAHIIREGQKFNESFWEKQLI